MTALVTAAVLLAPAAAGAVQAARGPTAAERFLDVRQGLAVPAPAAPATPAAGLAARSARMADRVASARRDLTASLGRQAALSVDPLTGTVRALGRLDGALTGPSDDPPATVARAYAAQHATALGLDAATVAALGAPSQTRSPTGLTVVRFGQSVDGVPAFDNDLRVAVDRAGRVLSVSGAPRTDLPAAAGTPARPAADALGALMDEVGARRPFAVVSTGTDARRTTRFDTGDSARLVLFGARRVHLAWHLTYAASSTRVYDAVVDAATGEVLYRANLVKFAVDAGVYHNFPGAALGGTRVTEDLEPFLASPGVQTLTGPNVHAFSDVNDDDVAQASEEVVPGDYGYSTDNNRPSGACDATHLCSWNHLSPTSWNTGTNRAANVTQTFWYANHFHDHLAGGAIGFTTASGNFQGADPVQLNALDGAATASGGPDDAHLDNANMLTPADGSSPRMQMYLFEHATGSPFRDINGGDDAAVLYHEYTHGLSSRLVTNDDGTQALNAPHAGAMGEAWSDWYAQDLLVREGLVVDSAGDGDVDMGRYTDSTPHAIRYEPLDCTVGLSSAACPGSPGTSGGGFTFADFGKVNGAPEVHSDGEIWAQTLWQLRQRLVAKFGASDGSDAAETIITDAMRLSVPEPSFLDMRNAILAAAGNDLPNSDVRDIVWDVFRSRGMGFYAAATDGSDLSPVADFTAPPAADAPKGAIGGTVISANSGLPLPGARAGIGGLATKPTFDPDLAATIDSAGHYAIGAVPQGTYPKLGFAAPGYDALVKPVTVAGGQTAQADAALRRDWSAAAGGAAITATNDDLGAPFGCGAGALIDQSQGAGWSAENHLHDPSPRQPTATIRLPQAITVESFAMDPANTCGDNASSATRDYRVETSPDGVSWTTAAQGSFAPADAGRLNTVTPTAGATGVRYVRLTLLSPQSEAAGSSGQLFIDFSELEVLGNPPNVLPSGTLTASATAITPGQTVAFDASSFKDPDSAITAYDWDFDGDGVVDATTATPTAQFTYPAVGRYVAGVGVRDFRGGSGVGAVTVDVTTAKADAPFGLPKPALSRPGFLLPSVAGRGRVPVRVTCKDTCRVSGTLTIDTATRRRLHLASRTVGRLMPRTLKGRRTLPATLTATARRALRRHHVTRLRVGVHLTATVSGGGPRRTLARRVTLRT
ncbi:PKD domain-containing protein [Baekduia soli]|uniref:alpha-amylase n=2 Tax=Baekduia soli TaxID=496014 RepID=A0A5B8U2N7_9ACTN|nr:PKD domain-containing protein [Baekduia soli]